MLFIIRMEALLNVYLINVLCATEQLSQFPTVAYRKNLYFNVVTSRGGNQTVTVEGAGVNATLVQADIAQTNGYVHIIDRVLGVPYATVLDKLRTDPMLKWVKFVHWLLFEAFIRRIKYLKKTNINLKMIDMWWYCMSVLSETHIWRVHMQNAHSSKTSY